MIIMVRVAVVIVIMMIITLKLTHAYSLLTRTNGKTGSKFVR